jgi:trimeric autotransporter adhesin
MKLRVRHLAVVPLIGCLAVAEPSKAAIGVGLDRSRTVPNYTCSGSGRNSFLGGGIHNVAAGRDAAVIGGFSNYACGASTVVAGGNTNQSDGVNNFIGGGSGNVAGNGGWSFIGAGLNNTILGAFSAIIAGNGNTTSAPYAFIGGGGNNNVIGNGGVIVNGMSDVAGLGAAVVGGTGNQAVGTDSFIGSGNGNIINRGYPSGASYAVIGGGVLNTINTKSGNLGEYGVIGGGSKNSLTGEWGVVSGGQSNTVSGKNATVPGGTENAASGAGSFAAGRGANAKNAGSFVWSDQRTKPKLASSGDNQFVARASGGVTFFSSKDLSTGVVLSAGSGSWSSVSDRAVKTAIVPLDDAAILAKVAALPVSEWSYAAQGTGVRHVGPMAQDFRAAFGVGEDDRHIAAVDEGGVALAAIKALKAGDDALRVRLARDDARLARDDAEIASLRSELARLASKIASSGG